MLQNLNNLLTFAWTVYGKFCSGQPHDREPLADLLGILIEQLPGEYDESQSQELVQLCMVLSAIGEQHFAHELATALLACDIDRQTAARTHNLVGLIGGNSGRLSDASQAFHNALIDAAGSSFEPVVLANLAMATLQNGDLPAALKWVDKYERLSRPCSSGDAIAALVKSQVGLLRNDLSSAEVALGSLERAVWNQALTEEEGVGTLLLAYKLANVEYEVAQHESDQPRCELAIEMLEILCQRFCSLFGASHPYAAHARFDFELVRYEQARSQSVPSELRRSIERLRGAKGNLVDSIGADHPRSLVAAANVAAGTFELARVQRNPTDMRLAIADLDAVSIRVAKALGPEHPQALVVASNAATAGFELARLEKSAIIAQYAIDALEVAATRSAAVFGPSHPASLIAQRELVACRALAAGHIDEPEGGGIALRVRAPAVAWSDDDDAGYISYEDVVGRLALRPDEAEEFLHSQSVGTPSEGQPRGWFTPTKAVAESTHGSSQQQPHLRRMSDSILRPQVIHLLDWVLVSIVGNGIDQVLVLAADQDLLDVAETVAMRTPYLWQRAIFGAYKIGTSSRISVTENRAFATFDLMDMSTLARQLIESRVLEPTAKTAVVILENLGLPPKEGRLVGAALSHILHGLPSESCLAIVDIVGAQYNDYYMSDHGIQDLLRAMPIKWRASIDLGPPLKASRLKLDSDSGLSLDAVIGEIQ